MKTDKLYLERILSHLPQNIDLIYVDYRDSLDEQFDVLQQCITENHQDPLSEKLDEWFIDAESNSRHGIEKQMKSEIIEKYDYSEEFVDELFEKFEDEIRDAIYDKDTSTPISDLLRNTSKMIAHYDTGFYLENGSWNWSDAEIRLERIKIKKHLNISNSNYDNEIDQMICHASYGGQLLVFFEIEDFDDFTTNQEIGSLTFNNCMIGIIDHFNGSGDIMDLSGHEMSFNYDSDNLYLEKTIKYNWTYSIAGMSEDWTSGGSYKISKETLEQQIEKSPQKALNEKERVYNENYKKGNCTAGDMDIKRHRNVIYINNYPCGNKCTDCGTFWID